MYAKKSPSGHLLTRARSQAGVITSRQLDEFDSPLGARRRWIDGWVRMGQGYYCLTKPSFESWCWAGILKAGETGAITGTAAGHLHGFVADPPRSITIYHQRCEPLASMGDEDFKVHFRRGVRAARGAPGRTAVEVAILDLARESTQHQAIAALTRAVAERMTTPERILRELEQVTRVRHQGVLRALCTEAEQGVQSVLEWLFLKEVVRRHGLPAPALQVSLVTGTRTDAVFEGFAFVVELDGRLGHEDEPFRDLARDNRLTARGVLTLRFGWRDVVTRPCAVAHQIKELLELKDWSGTARSCPECPSVSPASV